MKRFRCTSCGGKFTTLERANAHIDKRHKNGALWIEGDFSIWLESVIGLDPEFKYWAVCELHGSCVGTDTKAQALSMKLADFCEICSGATQWCRTCGQMESQFGHCKAEGHDIGPGSLTEFYAEPVAKPVIAYGWRQQKKFGGNLLLVCAECRESGKGYVGEPTELTGPFDEPINCVFCKKVVQ